MSSKSFPLDLPLLISGNPCGVAATPSRDTEPGSGNCSVWVKGKRLKEYTDSEIVEVLKFAIEEYQNAQYQYTVCARGKSMYWFNQIRNWGGLWKRCNQDMNRRGILYDPRNKWGHATGRKGDNGGKA